MIRFRPACGHAFTMVEVLVAVSLSMLMVAAAWSLFSQTQRIARRTQARLQLHASAKNIYESLRRDLLSLQQHGALWLREDSTIPGFDLVFLGSAMDEAGYQMKGAWDNVAVADLVWVQWRWNSAKQRLESARNLTARTWSIDPAIDGTAVNPDPLSGGETLGMGSGKFERAVYWPQPRRYTTGDLIAGLDGNQWRLQTSTGGLVGEGRNRGDWGDLKSRLGPVCAHVEACTIELVKAAGGVFSVDGSANRQFCAHGVRMDGVASRNVTAPAAATVGFADEIDERPALLRISFVLRDAATGVSMPFSFSVALPGPNPHP